MKKLDKKIIRDIYALTPMQEGMLYHYLKNPVTQHYFEQLSLEICGEINPVFFEKAWNLVVNSNEVLRTVFRWEKLAKPTQVVLGTYRCQMEIHDLCSTNGSGKGNRLIEIKEKDRKKGFDLQEVPFRVILCKTAENKYCLIISYHHILCDGWSCGIILKEFFSAYAHFCSGEPVPKPLVKPEFKDIIQWYQQRDREREKEFWKSYFDGMDTAGGLPGKPEHQANAEVTAAGNRYGFSLGKRLSAELEDFLKKIKSTAAIFFYSAWGVLLRKYDNAEEVVFGTTVAGRDAPIQGIEEMVGLLINTLPLRVAVHRNDTVIDLLNNVKAKLNERKEYETSALADIKEYAGFSTHQQLFDTVMVMENYPLDSLLQQPMGSLSLSSYSMFEMPHYDLTVCIMPGDDIRLNWCCGTDSLDKKAIIRLGQHFKGVIENLILYPGRSISSIEFISRQEKKRLLVDFNRTDTGYPLEKDLQQLFKEQVEKRPDNTALLGLIPDSASRVPITITYRELNERLCQLAYGLRENGTAAGSIVGIMAERSVEMVIGIMGILKAGAAYLPIAPDYPRDRVTYMLKDSGAAILLTDSSRSFCPGGLPVLNFQFSMVNFQLPMNPVSNCSPNLPRVTGACLAYVIYTSGSTGIPKGVMVEQSSVLNLISALQRKYPLNETGVYLLKTSYIFDVSVAELFGWYPGGGRLAIPERGAEGDPRAIINAVERWQVTHINFVPSMFNAFVQLLTPDDTAKLSYLRYIFLAGETLLPGLVEQFRDLKLKTSLENIYGPTEATVYASWYSLADWGGSEVVPIGRPLPNVFLVILDRWCGLQPIGIPGELCIGGNGLARGYLNQPELTAERFCLRRPGGRFLKKLPPWTPRKNFSLSHYPIYMTGDRACWLEDGNIEFLGRMDHQVKIRGFRIELGEIESHLLDHPLVKEAVVIAPEDKSGEKDLYAYVVATEPIVDTRLREHLSKVLPDYMIPSCFVQLDRMPLSRTGKVNRNELPEPEVKTGKKYIAPRNKREELLVDIWSQILGVEKQKIGIDDNFFELGGHSLKIVGLIGRIHRDFDIEVPFSVMFKTATVRKIDHYIREAETKIHQAIPRAEQKEYYPLAPSQRRFYVFQQLIPEDISYNMPETMLLEGQLDREKIEMVFRQLLFRHESLRTSFQMVKGEAVQRFHREVTFAVKYHDLEQVKSRRQEKIVRDFFRPFDLTIPPLWRVELVKTAPGKHLLLFDMHHLITDGTSTGIFIRDFLLFYNQEPLPPLKLQFRDYVEWRKWEWEKTGKGSRENASWDQQEDQLLNLPTDFPRPSLATFAGRTIRLEMEVEASRALQQLSINHDVTFYMVLLAAYNVLLSKLSGQENIAVGSPVAGRNHVDLEHVMGLFLNALCLRNQPHPHQAFSAFLQEVKARAITAFEKQDYQYDELMTRTTLVREQGRNPLFDVMLVLQNMEMPDIHIPGLRVTREVEEYYTSKFDMTLFCEEKEPLVFKLEYSSALFKPETGHRFMRYFQNIISRILQDPHQKIADIEMISQEEKQQILYTFNDTEAGYPHEQTLHRLFAQQAEKLPDNIALIAPGTREHMHLTYGELHKQTNRLARRLEERGVRPDAIVSIIVERSMEMVIGILAILKAGGAYLPIIPGYPQKRIDYILADSGARVLLALPEARSKIKVKVEESNGRSHGLPLRMINVDADFVSGSEVLPSTSTLTCGVSPANLAYVIYTSGSTGKPKGVMVEHISVLNLLFALQKAYPFRESDVYLLKTSFIFDVSVAELFGWFLDGGRLVIMEKDGEKDPIKILAAIQGAGVTHINFVPSMFNVFVESLSTQNIKQLASLRYIFLAGETLLPGLVEKFRQFDTTAKLENIYGPTEGTVYSSKYSLSAWKGSGSIPIGKPILNVRLYILDRNGLLQPLGVPGELCIGGVGLARGYLNNPELTFEKFIDFNRSYRSYKSYIPNKLYRTGDLCRWQPDGNIEFFGRIDFQVKIRGFRIELGEIESRLSNHDNVKENLVLAKKGNKGDKYLCAYIVPREAAAFEEIELREYLAADLPDYMVPAYFVMLDKIPLTPGGKPDRKVLPEPDYRETGREYIAPQDEIERKLVDIWLEVLQPGNELISTDANFFKLGGHSLKAALLISKIHQVFNVQLPVGAIFQSPTVSTLAAALKQVVKESYVPIKPTEKKEYYPLALPQKRLYILQQLNPGNTGYNLKTVLKLEGELNKDRLGKIFARLIRRHESLRTSFAYIDGEPVQKVSSQVDFSIEYFEDQEVDRVVQDFTRPFDLSRGPLVRVGLITREDSRHILIVDMHHTITDGISSMILSREFMALSGGEDLPNLPLQYTDYSEWQTSKKRQVEIKRQGEFWLKQFEDGVPFLELPTDYLRPAVRDFAGSVVDFRIPREKTTALKELAFQQEASIFMVLLSIYNILLSKLSGQEDIIVGTGTAGRRHADLMNIIGLMFNTIALRNYPSGDRSFSQFLKALTINTLKMFENQEYPLDRLVEDLFVRQLLTRDASRNPLFDTMFAIQNFGENLQVTNEIEIAGLRLEPYRCDHQISRFDLFFICFETNDTIHINVEYSTALFKPSTVEKITGYYMEILDQILENTEIKLKDIDISTCRRLVDIKEEAAAENSEDMGFAF
ncbi:MAG: amino acid adenylation domain-containing protein [Candidatus Aminicenantes bacterium]|jgi:amino acid adenylation domain-containing protein